MFTTLAYDSTCSKGKHCLSSVRLFVSLVMRDSLFLIFKRNSDNRDVMKNYRSRLHMRFIADALLMAILYIEMYSIA